jgi:hypothetical protein
MQEIESTIVILEKTKILLIYIVGALATPLRWFHFWPLCYVCPESLFFIFLYWLVEIALNSEIGVCPPPLFTSQLNIYAASNNQGNLKMIVVFWRCNKHARTEYYIEHDEVLGSVSLTFWNKFINILLFLCYPKTPVSVWML